MVKPSKELTWFQPHHIQTSVDNMVSALIDRDDAAERIADMALRLGPKLDRHDAAGLAALARSCAPNDPWINRLTANAVGKAVPDWHWAIARDERRNVIYDKALHACLTPDSIVLEVGTGTGILAMMAARAGAKHVYTIEIEPLIAQAARENVRRNGYEDRITVICADATKVVVGDQLPERCNVFLHEIISNDLLVEHVLEISTYVRSHLLTDDAMMMPENIWMTCQLSNIESSARKMPIASQAGFDLSAMDLFYTPNTLMHGPVKDYVPLSDEHRVLEFDLTGTSKDPACDQIHNLAVTDTAKANAVVQWIGFSFPDGTEFTNPPDTYSSWALRIWRMTEQDLVAGDTVAVRLRYDDVRAVLSV